MKKHTSAEYPLAIDFFAAFFAFFVVLLPGFVEAENAVLVSDPASGERNDSTLCRISNRRKDS